MADLSSHKISKPIFWKDKKILSICHLLNLPRERFRLAGGFGKSSRNGTALKTFTAVIADLSGCSSYLLLLQ